jgi:hypothetical protein
MLFAPLCPWEGFSPGTVHFCEERRCAWIAEPANAWSNLAFLAVGVFLLHRARTQRRTPLYLVGVTSILVGLGSFLFHMSGTFFGEYIDLSAMFLIGSLMVTLEGRRFVAMSTRTLVLVYASLVVLPMLVLLRFRTLGIALFAAQVTLVYLSNIIWKLRKVDVIHRFAFRLGATFAVAFGIWALDLSGLVCRPDNHVFTGHSVWHILCAVCLYFFYRHQEQFVPARPPDTPVRSGVRGRV